MADSYWQVQLAGLEPTTFPDLTGKSSSAQRTFADFQVVEQVLEVSEDISHSLTPAACLAACVKVLNLYLGERDISLPIRMLFEHTACNKDILSLIEQKLVEAQTHNVPSEHVLQQLLESSDTAFSDVLITIRNQTVSKLSFPSELFEKYTLVFDLVLPDTKDANFLDVITTIHYRSSHLLYDDTTRVLNAFEEALLSLCSNPPSAFLSWGTNSRSQESISNISPEAADCLDKQVVHAAFERHAAQRPNDIALEFMSEDQTRTLWTFSTLNSLANHIANKLIHEYNFQVEDSIPICVSKSPAFYACILGVLKAGGTFTPFAGSPGERQKYMLHELGSKIVLCTDEQDMSWALGVATLNVTPLIAKDINSRSTHVLQVKCSASPSNLCYQMYTSGSTGQPKAVSLEHQNAVQTACATRDLIPWNTNSRILQQAGVTFDMCYFETFFAWTTGICLCSASDHLIYNKLTGIINDMDVTLLGLTPSVALTLDPEEVPSIEWMYCIGEALPQSLVNAWEGRLVNSYGPTEAAQMVTLFPVEHGVKSTVFGKPFKNTSFVVLRNNSTEVVPLLGVGELCIGGFQVARGYYKNPEKTKHCFITFRHQRLYRTGDLVRMLGDGNFEFIGRVDDQVKVRGQRVELGEIDNSLRKSHQAIERACTQILRVNDKSKGQLVAFLVLKKPIRGNNQHDVRRAIDLHISETLPVYMIPKLFLFIDSIPLSPSGKVDKGALTQILRQSNQTRTSTPQAPLHSSQKITQLLQHIYSEHCGLPPSNISPEDSIYRLGIDSISAIQIAQRLRDEGFEVQASDIMNHSSISQLSPTLLESPISVKRNQEDSQPAFDFEAFDHLHRSKVEHLYNVSNTKIALIRPASPLQSGMVAQSIHSSGSMYFNHLSYQLPSDVDLQRFFDAWDTLISKHEILRSGFVVLDDTEFPVAMITYHARCVSVPVQNLSNLSNGDELNCWRLQFTKSAVQNLHRPPWQVAISATHDKFYLSAHHALYDAQVLDLLMQDLTLAYDGTHLPIRPALDIYLARFLHAKSVHHQAESDFWQDHGTKAVASKFPIMHSLFEEATETRVATGPSPLALSELEQECRISGISMQAAAQAAWGCLLGALTGEDIVTFGTIMSGRNAKYSNEVSFPMITTVPTIVNNRTAHSTIVRELMRFNADVQQNQFVPLKKIQSIMGFPDKTLFDTVFTFQKRSLKQFSTRTVFGFLDNELAIEYPVSVELEPVKEDQLQFSIFYRSDYMCPDQASLLVDQFHFLLHNIIIENESASIPTAANADPHLFSVTPPVHEALTSERFLLHHSVELTARDNPNKVAIEFVRSFEGSKPKKQSWTFQELNEEGNKVAHLLQKLGIAQGSIVAMCFDKCPEAAFAMLGISKAGCGFLALDPGAPAERQSFILQDSQASVLLTTGSLASTLRSMLTNMVVDIGIDYMSGCSAGTVHLESAINPQQMAYCLYTSGTTGTPKGCVVTHENVIQVFLCFEKLYAYTDESRWLQFASYHFDVSVMEHFWSWFVGMTVVKASRDLVLQDLPGAISTLQITHIDLTPSLARLLNPKDVPTLASGVFVTGGEMLRQDIIESWGDSGAIHNAYGPTEATIGVTMYRHVPKNGRPSNIGWPFDVVGIFVVHPSNPNLPVIRGGIGELLVTGKLVAKGYLGREKLTRERFIEVAGQRCYRTGDLVRILSDGSIAFLGRADDQVKLRGQRLEIGEINTIMKQQDNSIDDVSTLVLKHPKQQKEQLVSFVAVHGLGSKKSDLTLCNSQDSGFVLKLRAACVKKLPGYMVPTHVLLVNKMPLSANNKVEGRQLKALYEHIDVTVLQRLVIEHDADVSDQMNGRDARQIREVLSQALGIDAAQISSSSSLFELGLDSVSVISFSRALKAAGYLHASPSLVMENPSVAALAAAVARRNSQAIDGSVQSALQTVAAYKHRYISLAQSTLSTRHEDIEVIMPCTALQAGIISRSLASNHGLYFAAFSFNLDKRIDMHKLRQGCQKVCDRVQVLRTKFIPTDNGYVQVILRSLQTPWVELEVHNEGQLDECLKDAHQNWWKGNRHEIQRPFELVIAKTSTEIVLALHIFHALYDGNSLPLIMNAVACEYNGNLQMSYGPDFSDALVHGPLLEAAGAKQFWVNQLSLLEKVSMRDLKPISMTRAQQDTSVVHRIDSINGLEECRRKLGVTHQAMLQACWAVLLQDIMAGPLVLGIIVSGRSFDLDGAESVIGPLFNTIPFLLTLTKTDTWKSIILRSHDFNTAALMYQHTPLRDIQRWTSRCRPNGALFNTLFVFQQETLQRTASEPPWTSREETFEADYPLALEVEQTLDGGFNLTLACQAYMSDEVASRLLLQRLERALKIMVENIDSPFSGVTTNNIFVQYEKSHGNGKDMANGTINGNGIDFKQSINKSSTSTLTETAKKVKEEIAALANVNPDDIDADTSIFEVGLDSIDAVKLSSRLKKVTGAQLPVSQIMRLLTLSRITAALEVKSKSTQQVVGGYDLERASKTIEQSLISSGSNLSGAEKVLPCTPLQEGMVADMLNSNFERYLNFDVLKLNKTTDAEILNTAWTTVINALPILRSRFVDVTDPRIDHSIAQIVMRPSPFEFTKIATPKGYKTCDFPEVFTTIRNDILGTFRDRPALRLTLFQGLDDNNARYLVLTLPHAMYDGWSLGIIHHCVNKAYHGDSFEVPPYEPALSGILNNSGRSSLTFWRQVLNDTKVTLFPTKHETNQNIHRVQRLSQVFLADVHMFCKQNKVTVAALCQVVWSVVLAYHTKQVDVSFAQVLSGRTDETANGVVFPTMNTVISRTILHGNRSKLVQYAQENLSAISEHQHFPLRKALTIAAGPNSGPLFNTLFVFQKSANDVAANGTQLYESVNSASNVGYPVCVEAEVTDGKLIWRTACEGSCLDEHETETLLERLDQVLDSFISCPNESVVDFSGNEIRLCSLPPVAAPVQQNVVTVERPTEPVAATEDREWSDMEQTIRNIVADVAQLDVSEIHKQSSVFGIGLDSISTIKVSSLLRKKGFKFSVNEILTAGTIEKIAELGENGEVDSNMSALRNSLQVSSSENLTCGSTQKFLGSVETQSLLAANNINLENVERVLPVSAGQMLLLSRWQNEGVYYSSLDFSAIGCKRISILQSAWHKLVERSPMLRTFFVATGLRDKPVVQVTLKTVNPRFIEVNPGSDLQEEADCTQESWSGTLHPPCALFAQKTDEDHYQLSLKISHALYDGFSLKMLISTFQELVNDNLSSSTAPQSCPFSTYLASTSFSESKRQFWSKYLADVKVLPLPCVTGRDNVVSAKQIHIVAANVLQKFSALRTFTRKHQVSVQSLLLASYSIVHALVLQHHHSRDKAIEDVLIGVFMANRNLEGIDELDAPTLGFAPVRVRKPLERSIVEIAQGIQDDLREISEEGRSQIGLWELQDWIGDHIKVDVWVNILRQWLPDKSLDSHSDVHIVTGEKSESLEKLYDVNRFDDDVENGLLLKDNAVRGSYDYPMVDLEATIKEDNLDIGIQAPTTLLDIKSARNIIQDVAGRLNDLAKDMQDIEKHRED